MHKNVWIISFDGVAISGIITEALKIATILNRQGFRILLDIGYDIKTDKGNFGRSYEGLKDAFPEWIELVRSADIGPLTGYNTEFLNLVFQHANSDVILDIEHPELYTKMEAISDSLAASICNQWRREKISYVIIENGTLPENIIFTKALYKAIDLYGFELGLSKFVIWRDHDLMWSSETSVLKYGNPPYPNAIKPVPSPYIQYVTLHAVAQQKLSEWAGMDVDIAVLPNTYKFSHEETAFGNVQERTDFVRPMLKIKSSDIVISRFTRLIFQKRIDRDIYLISRLRQRFVAQGIDLYLLIIGDINESPHCYQNLVTLIKKYDLGNNILFLGGLPFTLDKSNNKKLSVETIISASDLVSFLTAYDYDSYGNPIGEAISQGTCYISTRYEYYETVYGSHGYLAPVMPITVDHDGLPEAGFVEEVYALLSSPSKMKDYAEFNFQTGEKHFSNDILGNFCKFFR